MAKAKPKAQPKRTPREASAPLSTPLMWQLFRQRTELDQLAAEYAARLRTLEGDCAHIQRYIRTARRGRR